MADNVAVTPVEDVIAQAEPAYQRWLGSITADVSLENDVLLYGPDTLRERNTTFEVARYAPGYLMIGDDGGGNGFLIPCVGGVGPVFRVGLGSLLEDDFVVVATTFEAWEADGFAVPPDR